MGVYERVPRSEQARTGGKIVGTRWVDVNKGDTTNISYRSRLVAKEFKSGPDDSMYAPTPPLEAMRMILSWAATTQTSTKAGDMEVMINDVSKAYFYTKISHDVYIEFPPEDEFASPGIIGKLVLAMYGTQDGAKNWQETLSQHLSDLGFVRRICFSSVFHHIEKGLCTTVHGDDYMSAGPASRLDWLEAELAKKYQIKTQRIGKARHAEGQVLNGVVRWSQEGWSVEADPRHVELILENIGLTEGKGVVTPSVKDERPESAGCEDDDIELGPRESTQFRGIAARANYLALDRPDIQFAAKEVCRELSKPTNRAVRRLKRMGRYLAGKPR